MPKLTTKSQITIPKSIEPFLPNDFDTVYFISHPIEKKVLLANEDQRKLITKPFIFEQGKILSKNQLTIPQSVRDYLKINPHDRITISIHEGEKTIWLSKQLNEIECILCQGTGRIDNSFCCVCDMKGKIYLQSAMDEIVHLLLRSSHYGITLEMLTRNNVPILKLQSEKMSQSTLNKVQNYYQSRLLEESVVHGNSM